MSTFIRVGPSCLFNHEILCISVTFSGTINIFRHTYTHIFTWTNKWCSFHAFVSCSENKCILHAVSCCAAV